MDYNILLPWSIAGYSVLASLYADVLTGDKKKILTWISGGVLAIGFILYYGLITPSSGIMPRCMIHTLTGLSCPGCGSQRFLHSLLTGHPLEALRYNYFLPFGTLIIIIGIWLEGTRKNHYRRYQRLMRPIWLYIILAAILTWTVVRNIVGI